MRKVTIPTEHEVSIWREIADSNNAAAGRILHAIRHAAVVDGGIEIEITEADALWAETYVGAAPIIGKLAGCFAPEEPRPGNEAVLDEVYVECKP